MSKLVLALGMGLIVANLLMSAQGKALKTAVVGK